MFGKDTVGVGADAGTGGPYPHSPVQLFARHVPHSFLRRYPMRFFRLSALMLVTSLAFAACSSPTAGDDDCEVNPELCGFPTNGN